jgi:hypothetical protein
MVSLDDRLLGEKLQNYCSSSSDDEDEKGKLLEIMIDFEFIFVFKDNDEDEGKRGKSTGTKFIPEAELDAPSSSSGFTDNVRNEIRVFYRISFVLDWTERCYWRLETI